MIVINIIRGSSLGPQAIHSGVIRSLVSMMMKVYTHLTNHMIFTRVLI